jgi:hypothetical protein
MEKTAKPKHGKRVKIGKSPPKMGSKMNADPKAKANFRARNTSKTGMGGPKPKAIHKKLAGMMI